MSGDAPEQVPPPWLTHADRLIRQAPLALGVFVFGLGPVAAGLYAAFTGQLHIPPLVQNALTLLASFACVVGWQKGRGAGVALALGGMALIVLWLAGAILYGGSASDGIGPIR
jgi:hypothetical protein